MSVNNNLFLYYEYDTVLSQKKTAYKNVKKNIDTVFKYYKELLMTDEKTNIALQVLLIMYDVDTIFVLHSANFLPINQLTVFHNLYEGYLNSGQGREMLLADGASLVNILTSGYSNYVKSLPLDKKLKIRGDEEFKKHVNYNIYMERILDRMELQAYILGKAIDVLLEAIKMVSKTEKDPWPRVWFEYRIITNKSVKLEHGPFIINHPELYPDALQLMTQNEGNPTGLTVDDLIEVTNRNKIDKFYDELDQKKYKDPSASKYTFSKLLSHVFITLYLQIYLFTQYPDIAVTKQASRVVFRAALQKLGILPAGHRKQAAIESLYITILNMYFNSYYNIAEQIQTHKTNVRTKVEQIVNDVTTTNPSYDRKVFFMITPRYLGIPELLSHNKNVETGPLLEIQRIKKN